MDHLRGHILPPPGLDRPTGASANPIKLCCDCDLNISRLCFIEEGYRPMEKYREPAESTKRGGPQRHWELCRDIFSQEKFFDGGKAPVYPTPGTATSSGTSPVHDNPALFCGQLPIAPGSSNVTCRYFVYIS
jgi:hypothetical protein